MKIGFYLENLFPGKVGGAEQYTRNLMDQFIARGHVCVLFTNQIAASTFTESEKLSVIVIPHDENIKQELYDYYIALEKIELLFCPLFYIPHIQTDIPVIAVIHDLQYKFYPEYFEKDVLLLRETETDFTITNADYIITISEHAKETIVEYFPNAAKKISVVYEDADESLSKVIDQKIKKKVLRKIPGNYIFYPASVWPHKNHINLIRAFSILINQYQYDLYLVLTGDAVDKLKDEIEQCGVEKRVISLGYVMQEEMKYYFSGASVMAFPSMFEGFGIPLVEAMRMGIPIACSDRSSIPEIVQDAAIIFDPTDPENIAEKISLIIKDQEQDRVMIGRGYNRASAFSWEKAAEQLSDIFRKQVAQKGVCITGRSSVEKTISIVIWGNGKKKDIEKTKLSIQKQHGIFCEIIVFEKVDKFDLKRISNRKIGFVNAGDEYIQDSILPTILYLQNKEVDMVCGKIIQKGFTDDLLSAIEDPKMKTWLEKDYVCMQAIFLKQEKLNFETIPELNRRCYFYQYPLYDWCVHHGGKVVFLTFALVKHIEKSTLISIIKSYRNMMKEDISMTFLGSAFLLYDLPVFFHKVYYEKKSFSKDEIEYIEKIVKIIKKYN